MKNISKKLTAFLAAAMCAVMLFGTVVSAANKDDLKALKDLTGASCSSKYLKLADKYSGRDMKTNTSYGKSKTKKYFDKLNKKYKNADAKTIQFKATVVNNDTVVSYTRKGPYTLNATYVPSLMGDYIDSYACYYTPDDIYTLVSFDDGNVSSTTEKLTVAEDGIPIVFDYDSWYGVFTTYYPPLDFINGLDIKDSTRGKSVKAKSGGKTYYYEEFETEAYGTVGYLFNSKGTLIAMNYDGVSYCVSIKTTVKDKDIDIPDKYRD